MKERWKIKLGVLSISIILAFGMAGCGNKGKSYYNTAVKNYNKGDYEAAAESFAKAIEAKDDDADYYLDYGACLIQLEQYEEAETMLNRAILEKDNSIVNKNNKKAYRLLGIMKYRQGDYETALSMFTKAMSYKTLNEYNVDIVSYKGSAELELGKYEEAVIDFTTVLESEPKNITALIRRGEAYCGLSKYEESIADYLEAKKIDSKDYDSYFGLYNVYTAQGDTSNAAAILEEASAIKVEDEQGKFNLAKIQYYQGNLTQALEGFKAASEQGMVESYFYLGDIYLSNEDYASAIYYYEMYLAEATTKSASFYNKLADCYRNTGSYEKALDAIEQGLKIAGSLEKQSLLCNEIIAYEHLGDYKTAYTKMEAYLSSYPEDEEAKREMEFLQTRQGNVAESEDDSEASDKIIKP